MGTATPLPVHKKPSSGVDALAARNQPCCSAIGPLEEWSKRIAAPGIMHDAHKYFRTEPMPTGTSHAQCWGGSRGISAGTKNIRIIVCMPENDFS